MDQDNDVLIGKAMACAHQQSKEQNEFLPSHWEAGVWPLPGKQGLGMLSGCVERLTEILQFGKSL